MHKMRKEIIDLKHKNAGLGTQLQDEKNKQSIPVRSGPPKITGQSQNSQQATQLRFVQGQLDQSSQKMRSQEQVIKKLQRQLEDKEAVLAQVEADKQQFQKLSENYMNEVQRLNEQLNELDLKPNSKSKMSQRPKDTVVRDQSHSLSNIHASRVPSVNIKSLADAVRLLKCRLQQKGLPSTHIDPLFFEPLIPKQEVSILQLKSKFETLGIDEKRSQSLARYLVEPQNQSEIIYNENAKAT